MVVRELIAKFGFEVDRKQIESANTGFARLKKAAIGVVGALVRGRVAQSMLGVANAAAQMADQIDKTSKRLGINAQALQEMQFAAGLAGASNEDLATSLRILSKNADEAAQGSKEYADEFKRLGVEVRDQSGQLKSAEELMTEMADGLGRLTSDTERTAVAQKLLGRSGSKLIPLLTQGTKAIEAQRKEARELGIFDQDLIDLGVELTDTNLRLSMATQAIRNIIAKALLPAMIAIKKRVIDWIKANRQFIAATITPILKTMAGVIVGLIELIGSAINFVLQWAASLDPLSKTILKVSLAIGVLAAILLLPGAAIVLLIGLIGLLIEDFMVWREGGISAIGSIIEKFWELLEPIEGLREFITGPLVNAFIFTWDKIKAVLGSFIEFFVNVFSGNIAEAFTTLWMRLSQIFTEVWDGLKEPLVTAIQFWKDTLFGFLGWIKDKFFGLLKKIPGFSLLFGGEKPKAIEGLKEELGAAIPIEGMGREITGPAIAAPPMMGAPSVVSAPRTTVDIQVQATPGMSEEHLASEIGRQMQGVLESQNRKALQAVTTVAGA